MASAITVNLIRAKHPVPRTIMDGVVQAADAGGSRAMNLLGYCFSCGLGVNRDLGQALDWYRKGAEAGNSRAGKRTLKLLARIFLASEGN